MITLNLYPSTPSLTGIRISNPINSTNWFQNFRAKTFFFTFPITLNFHTSTLSLTRIRIANSINSADWFQNFWALTLFHALPLMF